MKILITTDAYNAMINGVAISVKTLTSALENAGHEVHILTLSQTHQSYSEGNVYYIGSIPLKIYPDTRASLLLHDPLVKELLDWEPDVVHSQCEFFTFLFAKKIAKQLRIPLVHTYHTLYEHYTHYFCPSKRFGKRIVAVGSRFICRQTEAVIAPTQKTAAILEGYGVDEPIHIIPTGLSFERFQKPIDGEFTQNIRAKFQIPYDAPVLVTLGRVAREKNIDFLIKQMNHPSIRSRNIHLMIIGDGPDRERLESLAHTLRLNHFVHFTGMVTPNEVGKYYRLGNAFVSASTSETQGLTYIEAMACGLPLLCQKDECLDGVLVSGENGYFFETAEEFVENCCRLFNSKETLTAMSDNALKKSTDYSKEMFANRAANLYQETILHRGEREKCIRFVCTPKQIWHKVMGY